MITALSMNPCIDLTHYIDVINRGGHHRAKRIRRDVCGKAVNVAYALANLGEATKLLGFDFIENGELLKDSLQKAGVAYDLVPVPGAIRTNVKIFEEESSVMTEFNQEGDPVSEENLAILIDKVINTKSSVLILSGSLPSGLDAGVYGEIIKQTKTPVILDAFGPALEIGLKAGAYIIKPNLHELEVTFGRKLPTRSAQLEMGRKLLEENPKLRAICLSLGSDGALMIGRNEAFFAPALDIPVRGVQGAGDSLVAGIALEKPDAGLDILLKSAVATAAASLIREGTLMATEEGRKEMLGRVEIINV